MSSGGINVSQPIVGMPRPVAGQQAGSVAPSGGLVEDGLPRTAALATGIAGTAYGTNAATNAAAATVAGQQVIDPATVQGSALGQAAAQRGPAAWNEQWAKQFKDAGAPSDIIQQLTFTGAMGADSAQLQQMLDQVKGEIDTQLAKFAHDHPDEFEKLRSNPAVDRAMIAQIAAGVNGGQVPADQLEQLVDSIGQSQGKMLFNMLVKPMLVYSLIPGWGALRLAFAPFTGGKDPLTGEKMFGDKMSTAFTLMTAVGGGITLMNHARGAMQVAQGHRLIAAGGDAALVAAHEGLGTLSMTQKLASYIPGTQTNKVIAGISRIDDLKAGIGQLSGIERELAQNTYSKIVAGEISIFGDSASKFTKMGYQPNTRGMLIGRNKALVTSGMEGAKPFVAFDGRATGRLSAAQLAAIGVEHADDTVANGMLKSRVFGSLDPSDLAAIKNLREATLGRAAQQMLDAGAIARPEGIQKLFGAVRPGPLQDAIWAADNVAAGTLGKLHGTAAIPKFAKFGIGGLLAAGAGYFMMIKPQQDAAKKAAEEAAKQQQGAQAGAGTTGGAGAGGGQVQMTPELQASLQQFAALPKEQQAQIIQQQYATLQQAAQQPGLTAEQQQQIASAAGELELFMQVANGGAATGTAATAGAQPGPAAAMTGAATGTATPAFTAQGLGLG